MSIEQDVYEALGDHGGRTKEGVAADVRLVVAELAAERNITLTADEIDSLRSGTGCVVRDGVRVLYD